MALTITDANYQDLAAQGKLMVLDFWATWCGPCKRLAPAIEALATQFEGQAIIGKVDIRRAFILIIFLPCLFAVLLTVLPVCEVGTTGI